MPVRTCNGVPYAGGVNIKKEFKQLSQQVTFVLNDSNGELVAKCIQDKGKFDTGYTIYGTRPLYKVCVQNDSILFTERSYSSCLNLNSYNIIT